MRASRRVLLLAVVLAAAAARAESFRSRMDNTLFAPVGRALALSIGRSLPVTSASSGIVFHFDPETSAFERETQLGGQLFLERAEPIGRHKLGVLVSWQRVSIDTMDGHDLDSLSEPGPPILTVRQGQQRLDTIPNFDLTLDTDQVTTSVTYGLTDDVEVNLTLPIVISHFGVDASVYQLRNDRSQTTHVDQDATGPGDLFLRGKYRFAHGRFGDLATGFVLRLPTGNEDNFQGTGAFELSPILYASTPRLEVASGVRLQGYLNAGLDLVPDDMDHSEGRVGLGVDVELFERASFGAAVLGRESFGRLAPPGAFDVVRLNVVTGKRTVSPLFGLDSGRTSAWDLSLGGRVVLWRDTLFLTGNVLLPLNDDGFRSDVIPLVGFEAVF